MSELPVDKNKLGYIKLLTPKWKELISFVINRKKEGYIQIVEAEFKKLIVSVLSDIVNINPKFEDKDIKFSLIIKYDDLPKVLNYMGKTILYKKMFDSGQTL
jgi:hypothetical protein